MQDSYAFRFKDKNIKVDKIHYFIVTSLNKVFAKYDWGNKSGWNKVRNDYIMLPVNSIGEIDFNFMENFVMELEAERVMELEAYLQATGLEDYNLTEEEEKAIINFSQIKGRKIKINTFFSINSSKKRFDANKITLSNKGFPYVVRTALNNGIKGLLNESDEYLNEGNTISFGQDTATIYYQEKPYFTGDKIKILKCKNSNFNKMQAMFFIALMQKSFSLFSWGNSSFSIEILENQDIYIPITVSGDPDYLLMETFIRAIQKLVIKDVVLYTNEKIKATKQVIS